MRRVRIFLVIGLVFYVAVVGVLLAVMRRPTVFGQVMRRVPEPFMMVIPFKQLWFVARAGRLQVGDPAPNFDLPTRDRTARIELASFRGEKSVVLVFGSYT